MTTRSLSNQKCVPCEGGVPALSDERVRELLPQIPAWNLEGKMLKRTFRFKNFVKLMEFVNQMAKIAEDEGHHPDFSVHYNILDVSVWTHAVNGLTENDFILATKIDGVRGS